jgi:hypothetical protein
MPGVAGQGGGERRTATNQGNRVLGLLCQATVLVDALRRCEVGDPMAFGLLSSYQQAIAGYCRAFGIG